jgi:hypothetical protein
MVSRFFGLVGSLPPPEQLLWFPNQTVQDPETWTLPHLIQLKHEYKKLVDQYSCVVQESHTVQDPSAPPSDILFLTSLTDRHTATLHIQELPQQGESRPVKGTYQS